MNCVFFYAHCKVHSFEQIWKGRMKILYKGRDMSFLIWTLFLTYGLNSISWTILHCINILVLHWYMETNGASSALSSIRKQCRFNKAFTTAASWNWDAVTTEKHLWKIYRKTLSENLTVGRCKTILNVIQNDYRAFLPNSHH